MTATDLPTRPLGRADMDVTRLGFGSWAVSGSGSASSAGPSPITPGAGTGPARP
ncbi:hypothetical protein [Streptomyces sp. 6N223]|uniref:hypothetical protein n=1 Tax=Streptomyces sp. 6N223 TaxID=3457412 RepID=UPI003FCFF98A